MKTLIPVIGPKESGKTTTAAQITIFLEYSGFRMLTFGEDLWATLQEDYCDVAGSLFGTISSLRRTHCDIAVCDATPHQVDEIYALSTDHIKLIHQDGVRVLPLILAIGNASLTPLVPELRRLLPPPNSFLSS